MPTETPEQFRTAKLNKKRRMRWWRSHIPITYAVAAIVFAVVYVAATLVDRNSEHWLRTIGFSPAEVSLVSGVAYCRLLIWGLKRRSKGIGWSVLYALCLLSGVLSLLSLLRF